MEPRRVRSGWGWALLRLTLFVASALGLTALLGLLVPPGLVGGSLALLAASLLAGWALLAWDGRPPGALGLVVDAGAPAEAGRGLLLGMGAAALVVAGIALGGGVRWTREAGTLGGFALGGLGLLARLTLPAAAEEVALRGYLLQAAALGFGRGPALVGTSVLFGLLHAANPEVGVQGMIGITAAGLLLGALVLRAGSLWWAVGAHLGWNWALAWPADLSVSGLDLGDTPGLEGRPTGPEWLSGGAFGPEASAVAVLVLGGLAAAVWWGRWVRPRAGRPAPLYAAPEGGLNGIGPDGPIHGHDSDGRGA
jgi:hypothetical protein